LPNFIEVDVVDDNENKQYLIKLKDVDKRIFIKSFSEGTFKNISPCILEFDEEKTYRVMF
jgi:hypothetical protein